MMVFMLNIIKQEILVGKSNLTYVEPYKRIINNIMFLVFLAIILGFLLTTSIRLILDKKEDVPKEQKEPEKNYYIYCYINSNIDNLIEPENGFYLEYKKNFVERMFAFWHWIR